MLSEKKETEERWTCKVEEVVWELETITDIFSFITCKKWLQENLNFSNFNSTEYQSKIKQISQ